MKTALVIVDFQADFRPGGALAVTNGDAALPAIQRAAKAVDYVAFTRDWHPENHSSFSEQPTFTDGSWPAHCVQDTPGAQIEPVLLETFPAAPVFSKATKPDEEAYSGFAGTNEDGDPLLSWLRDRQVVTVYVVGLALDYCVKATALDALKYGFDTIVIADGTRPVDPVLGAVAAAEVVNDGGDVVLLDSTDLDV